MANRFIERLRNKIPYVRRLHREIDELRHQLAAAESAPVIHETSGDQPSRLGDDLLAFLALLQPHDVPERNKLRVGAAAGYVMLDDFAPVRHALSLGIGSDVSWDKDIADRGIRVLQYDHSVNASPQIHVGFSFQRKRVVGTAQGNDDVTLTQIMESASLANDGDIVAKIDIEGDEWEVLNSTKTSVLARIRQLAVEFHWLRNFCDANWRATAAGAMRNITATHCCIHVHGTNWAPLVIMGGVAFPSVFEATFVRRQDHRLVPSTVVFPTPLDRPCNPKKPDFYMGRWNY
jgi:hypothetical protein